MFQYNLICSLYNCMQGHKAAHIATGQIFFFNRTKHATRTAQRLGSGIRHSVCLYVCSLSKLFSLGRLHGYQCQRYQCFAHRMMLYDFLFYIHYQFHCREANKDQSHDSIQHYTHLNEVVAANSSNTTLAFMALPTLPNILTVRLAVSLA